MDKLLDFFYMYSEPLMNINWIVTYSALIFILVCSIRVCFYPQIYKKIQILSFNKRNFSLFLLLIVILIILIKHIPIREGYDNYHGIQINTFDRSFKEVVATIVVSSLNQLTAYRMAVIFVLNLFLSIACSLILSLTVYLRFKNITASITVFILLVFSPMSAILIKTISSAHTNLFLFLLALFLLTLFNYLLKKRERELLYLFIILSVLLALINNVRQEYLFFLFPFILESSFLGLKSGFVSKYKKFILVFIVASILLFCFFNIFQLSLKHHNQPYRFLYFFSLFSPRKFWLLNPFMNILLGAIALISPAILVIRKKYFFSFALFNWLLLSSNIYSIKAEFPLQFLRHELYLSIPFIICLSIISMELSSAIKHMNRQSKSIILGTLTAMYLVFCFYCIQQTRKELRTTDYALQFFHKKIPELPKNMKLATLQYPAEYSPNLFAYISSMYMRHFSKITMFTSGGSVFYTQSGFNSTPGSYILYYPEICDLLTHVRKNETFCQKLSLFLGRPIALTSFMHKYNDIGSDLRDKILIKIGFYEPTKGFYDGIGK